MSRSGYIHKGCDNDVTFDGALNSSTGSYLNSATCTFSLYESVADSEVNGAAVTGATGIAMAYVAASNGDYAGVLQSTVALVLGSYYWLERHLVQGDIVLHKRRQVQCVDEGDEAG